MKKLLLVLIPSLILATIIFLLVQNFVLKRNEKGALQVTSAPPSKVYLNDELIGETPLCKCEAEDMVTTGEYTIRVVPNSGDFQEFQEKITVEKSVLTVVDRTFAPGGASEGSVITLQPLKNSDERELLVLSIPDASEVLLDNSSSGFTPVLLRDITESDHEITIKKSGYGDKRVRIRTPSGYKLIATVYLGVDEDGTSSQVSPTPTVVASPSATPVVENDKVKILETPVGFLRVRASASTTASEVGRVNPGQTFTILEETDSWYQIELPTGEAGWVSSQYASKQ